MFVTLRKYLSLQDLFLKYKTDTQETFDIQREHILELSGEVDRVTTLLEIQSSQIAVLTRKLNKVRKEEVK